MSILRMYEPSECNVQGVPLDWERCRTCKGQCYGGGHPRGACDACGGHGSLKAAALADISPKWNWTKSEPLVTRCESCSHPMSEGTWGDESSLSDAVIVADASILARLNEIDAHAFERAQMGLVHYSPCDEGCRHGGPGREWWEVAVGEDPWAPTEDVSKVAVSYPREASWRPVDVRTLGWPHDLWPEKLAVLCLRCFAERGA